MVPLFLIGALILGERVQRDRRRHRPGVAWRDGAQRAAVPAPPRSRPICCSCGACRRGYDHRQVLFEVDIDVREGEIVALLGTNGAGKSTLLKAISGVVEADRGAVVLDGRDITHAPPNEIAALGISQMPGGQGVFGSLTVAENLQLAGWTRRRRSRRRGGGHRRGVRDVPGAARSAARAPPPTCRAASSRCSRSAWRSSPGRGCC